MWSSSTLDIFKNEFTFFWAIQDLANIDVIESPKFTYFNDTFQYQLTPYNKNQLQEGFHGFLKWFNGLEPIEKTYKFWVGNPTQSKTADVFKRPEDGSWGWPTVSRPKELSFELRGYTSFSGSLVFKSIISPHSHLVSNVLSLDVHKAWIRNILDWDPDGVTFKSIQDAIGIRESTSSPGQQTICDRYLGSQLSNDTLVTLIRFAFKHEINFLKDICSSFLHLHPNVNQIKNWSTIWDIENASDNIKMAEFLYRTKGANFNGQKIVIPSQNEKEIFSIHVHECWSKYQKEFQNSDPDLITIRTNNGQEIKALKDILVSKSKVFERMLESEMAESKNGLIECSFDFDVMKLLIQFLYSGVIFLNSDETQTSVKLFEAADYYGIECLKNFSLEFFRSNLKRDDAMDILIEASEKRIKEMVEICKNFFVQPEYISFI